MDTMGHNILSGTLPLFMSAALMLSQAGCVLGKPSVKGSGTAATQSREVQRFTKVTAGGSFDVHVTIGEPQSVMITGDDNIVPLIETTVVAGELRIRSTESISPKLQVKVEIVTASLESAELAGSGNVRIDGLNEPALALSIAGSGDVTAAGTAAKLSTSIAGSGSMRLENLVAKDASVDISGSGETIVNASDSLQVSIAGSGDVTYIGSPKQLQQKIAGSGTLRKK